MLTFNVKLMKNYEVQKVQMIGAPMIGAQMAKAGTKRNIDCATQRVTVESAGTTATTTPTVGQHFRIQSSAH